MTRRVDKPWGEAFHVHEETTLFEASTPELDDVVRLQDRHGRIPPKPAPDSA